MTSFDSDKFRQVLGHFPTGVTVITAARITDGDTVAIPVGFSVGSFASVSLEPPLVMFCAGKDSQSWPDIEATGKFCVNVLGDTQSELSTRFASKDLDKFQDVKWETRATGSPVLEGTLCWIDCEIQDVVEAGDHYIVIGEVVDLDVGADTQTPLIFFKGSYNKIQPI